MPKKTPIVGTPSIRLVEALQDHLGSLWEIVEELTPYLYKKWELDDLKANIAAREVRFALNSQDQLVGFVVYQVIGGEVRIIELMVKPDFERKGFGRAILLYVLAEFNHARRLWVELHRRNHHAYKLFYGLGFTVEKIHREDEDWWTLAYNRSRA